MDEAKVPYLRAELVKVQSAVDDAKKAANDPPQAATPLLQGLKTNTALISRVSGEKGLAEIEKRELLGHLRLKRAQFEEAINLALGFTLSVAVDAPVAATPEEAFMAVPGQVFGVAVRLRNPSDRPLAIRDVALDLPQGWRVSATSAKVTSLAPGKELSAQFRVTVPENAEYTRPYWHRNDPETDGLNTVDDARYSTLPFPPPPLQAHVTYSSDAIESQVRAVGTVSYKDSTGREQRRALAVAPPFSVSIDPIAQVIPVGQRETRVVKMQAQSGLSGSNTATVRLSAPSGWQVEPASQRITLGRVGEVKDSEFRVIPSAGREGRFQIKASLDFQGKSSSGWSPATISILSTITNPPCRR